MCCHLTMAVKKGLLILTITWEKKVSLTCLCSRQHSRRSTTTYKVINDLPLSKFQFWNPLVRRKILSLIRKQRFTHIIIEHPWHGWLGKYKRKYGFTFIVHAHNIEHLRIKEKNKLWWRFLKKTEQKAIHLPIKFFLKQKMIRKTAMSLFHISPEKCLIVPYGIRKMNSSCINPK